MRDHNLQAVAFFGAALTLSPAGSPEHEAAWALKQAASHRLDSQLADVIEFFPTAALLGAQRQA